MCVYIAKKKKKIKEMAHAIMEAGNSELWRVGSQAGGQDRANAAVQVWRPTASRIPSYLRELQSFNLLDEAHPHYGMQSASLKVYPFKCWCHTKRPSQKHPQ